jgi:preprotein translocase subunit YajC
MKGLIAREFLYFFLALIVAVLTSILFISLSDSATEQTQVTSDELVFEMEVLLIGGLLGFAGVYFVRFTVWAIKKVATKL